MKTVHPNNREFRPYDIAGTLDKQYVLAGYHSFVKYGQRIIVFNSISAFKIGYNNTNLYLDIDLSNNRYQFYGIFVINILFPFKHFFIFYIFI